MTPREHATPQVPDFDLIRPVGRGGFGEVWLARNCTTGRLRAIKLIPLQRTGGGDPAGREISSLTRLEANARCHHANLLRIDHVGKTAEYLFYVMDPADDVSGAPATTANDYRPATLDVRLQHQALTANCAFDYARQLLEGLAALHASGMVHRDVKPANCLFVGGQLKLADFGLLTEASPLVSRLGTQKYMPPDGRMDMRADVYAAGLVIYEMLSGLPVEEFPRLGRSAQKVCSDPILSVLLHVALHACELEYEKRPSDAREMLAELLSPQRDIGQLSRRRMMAAACGSMAVVLCGWGAWMAAFRSVESTGPEVDASVAVSFVTDPFEANIYIDGALLRGGDGMPCTTPCTAAGLPAKRCNVKFEWEGSRRADAGEFDLAKTRQIVFP